MAPYDDDTLDGCGGRCGLDGLDGLDGLGDLGYGMVQMLMGLSDFGYLGYTEHLAYGSLDDLSEGYPLGDVEIGGDEYGYDAGSYDDYSAAPAPDSWDIPMGAGPNQEELAEILVQRRQAIADAMKQREVQTQKVAALDREIVEVLNPQYQQALADGDEQKALTVGGRIRVLNLQRVEAVQKALDWASFQATASQMAKNARAQIELQQLYMQTMQSDPGTAYQISQVYAEIGRATAAIKQARAAQLQQKQLENTKFRQGLLQSQSERVSQAMEKMKAAQQAVYTAQQRLVNAQSRTRTGSATAEQRALDKAKKAWLDSRAAYVQQKMVLDGLMKAAKAPVPVASAGEVPESLTEAGLQGLDAMAPFCTVYTRDGYGPTCAVRRQINLGGLDDLPDSDELAWSAQGLSALTAGLQGIAADVGQLADWFDVGAKVLAVGTTSVAEELKSRSAEKKSKEQRAKELAVCEADCRVSAAQEQRTSGKAQAPEVTRACLLRCQAGMGTSLVKPAVVNLPMPGRTAWWERPGVVTALALVAGGVGMGVYMATRQPSRSQPAMQGLGRHRSPRRRR